MLLWKLVRDLWKNRMSTLTIVLITTMGVMFWSGFEGIASNGLAITDSFYEACAMPDLFVTGSGLDQSDVRAIERGGGGLVMGRNVVDMTVPALDDAVLRIFAQARPALLNRPVYLRGDPGAELGPRDLLLDEEFLAANGLEVGDPLRLEYGGRLYTFTVAAGVRTPENIYLLKDVSSMIPDHQRFGYALADGDMISGLLYGGEDHVYNQIVLTAQRPDEVKAYITSALAGKVQSVTDRSEHVSASMVELEFSTIGSIVGVFPTVFFLIAALIAFTSLRRMVEKERTAIGTMKALGVKDGAILAHYTAYGLLFGGLAAALGVPLGLLIPRAMFTVMDLFFSLPPYELKLNYTTSAVAALTAVLVSTLSALWACRGVLTLSPSVCMRPKSAKAGRRVLLERVAPLWSRLDDISKVVLRNMFRNKDRLVMSVFGVSCSCALLLIAFGMQSSINYLMTAVYEKVNLYDMKVFFEAGTTPSQARRVADLGGGELVMETGAKVTGPSGRTKTAAITVVPDTARLLGIYDGRDLDAPLPGEGCILSDVLAAELGVGEGDEIRVRFTGAAADFTLPVRKVMVQNFGQGIFVGQTAWRAAGERFFPTAALLAAPASGREDLLRRVEDHDFVLDAQYKDQQKESLESDLQMTNISVSMMILFAGAMAFVVLFNLGVLNFYERERELATLKVVGFSHREVRRMAFGENYLFVLIGCLFGLLLGNWALDAMLGMVETEHYTFTKYLDAGAVLSSVLTLFLFALLTNRFLSRYLKKIDLIASLKGAE